MDVKKELIGNFFRSGTLYTQEAIRVNDHDFPSNAIEKVIPHGLYDIKQNIGYMTLGTSYDTAEFACECIRQWWRMYGQIDCAGRKALLLLCDCGGSNNARHHIFKEEPGSGSDLRFGILQHPVIARCINVENRRSSDPLPICSLYYKMPMGQGNALIPLLKNEMILQASTTTNASQV